MKNKLKWLCELAAICLFSGIVSLAFLAMIGEAWRAESAAVYTKGTESVEEITLHVVSEYATLPDLGNLTEAPAEYIAKTVWGEARGCSTTEQAAVVWCILNRVDSELAYMPDDIIGVVTQDGQFAGYREDNPVTDEIYALVVDVLVRWCSEDSCVGDVGRVLPEEYLWFTGDGLENAFRDGYPGGNVWVWELASPYNEKA